VLEELNNSDKEFFVNKLGGIFEHSPWVAEGSWGRRPFASVAELHQTMCDVVRHAPEKKRLTLLRAHPDLAGKAALAGDLTASSKREQAGAGLHRLTQEEYQRFHELNNAYKAKFAFPFILAVKGHSKESILKSFEERLLNSLAAEKARALEEIYKIASFRLEALLTSES
jgi:2-oxo-4-hydroxy-4-carboxy-5-ureidoimidazoline decarboxylase